MRRILLLATLISVTPILSFGQLTQVTAQVKDTNNTLYVNCQWSVVFVHQNTTPGAGPDAPAALLNGQQGNCDSFGNITVSLADNINTVTPTPSQWSFSICSASGYVAGPYCRTNMLITITGASQNLTSFFQPLMPVLPPTTGGGGLPTALVGSVLASAGINVNPVFQLKPVLDIRDKGVDCSGATNSDAALTFLATTDSISSSQLQIPNNCQIHVINTILIKNQKSFSIIGVSRPGSTGAGATITCVSGGTCNGGPLVDMEFVAGFEIAGLTLDANGLSSISLNIDKTGSGAVYNTTDGRIHDMAFNVKGTGGGSQNWVGVALSQVSTANVEDMRITDSSFFCNSRPSNNAHYGVRIFNSQNAKGEVVRHNNFNTCFYDVWSQQGNVQISENEFSSSGGACATGTGSDIRVDGDTDVDVIDWNLDENGTQFFNCNNDANLSGCNTSFTVSIRNNHFSPAGCENTGVYWINAANSPTPMEIKNNAWDLDSSLLKVIGSANAIVRPLYVEGNVYPNQLFNQWWTNAASQASPGSGYTQDYGIFTSNLLFSGAVQGQGFPSPFVIWRSYPSPGVSDDFAVQEVNGALLFKHAGVGSGTVTLDGALPNLRIGQLIAPSTLAISNQGTPGSTSYTYAIVPYVGTSGCTGGFTGPATSTLTTATGAATLNSTNFNQLHWIASTGATEYGIWRTASGGTPSSTGKIACITGIQNFNTNYAIGSGTSSTAYPITQVIVNTNYQYNDQGAAGDSSSLPSTNTTGSLAFIGGKGQHIQTQASNNDIAGVCSGTTTTCSVVFTTTYTSTPSCVLTPTTAGVTSFIITTQAATGFTVTYAPSATTNFNYICVGNPN